MPASGQDRFTIRLSQKIVAEAEGIFERAWNAKHSRIGDDAHDGAKREWRDAKMCIARDDVIEPGFANCMLRRVRAERVDQDIYIWKNHLRRRA